jgi:prolyl-tRNA synthetase
MLDVYKNFFEKYLAIPVITGKKTEKEKFAGAEYTLTIEALMHNGVCLQSGTSHYFGQKFTKAFDIKFLSRNNNLEYPYQTSWGTTTRMIGALIMVHGDDNGLVLPPYIAPRQVAIIPISKDENVMKVADEILSKLEQADISAFIDKTDRTPGFKFAEHEMNGIPIRIEIGNRDLENNQVVMARRDTYQKQPVSLSCDMVKSVKDMMDDIQKNMYDTAKKNMTEKTYECKNLEEVSNVISTQPGFIKAMWCGNEECELKMKEIGGVKSRCIPFYQESIDDKCVCCGKKAKHLVMWGIQY